MGSSVTGHHRTVRGAPTGKPICTRASKNITCETFSLHSISAVVKYGVLPQIFRSGTLGWIVCLVSNAVRARRAREEQSGTPRVEFDCTASLGLLYGKEKKW